MIRVFVDLYRNLIRSFFEDNEAEIGLKLELEL